MKPLALAPLLLFVAAEVRAQSLRDAEMSRIRIALAVFVALLLFFSIKRGAPVRGSRRWFWEATADDLGPDLARLRAKAINYVVAGAFFLIMTVILGGYAVGDALADTVDKGGTFVEHLSGSGLLLMGLGAAAGTVLLVLGLRMAPAEPSDHL